MPNESLGSDLEVVLRALQMPDKNDKWQVDWKQAAEQFDEARMVFLKPEFTSDQCSFLDITDPIRSEILSGLDMFERVPALKRLLWYCHFTGFRMSKELQSEPFWRWSAIPDTVDGQSRLFYIYLFLSGLPYIRSLHSQLNIPDDVTNQTLGDLLVWIHDNQQKTGLWGLDFSQVGWLGLHFSGNLYQLGRLQFQPTPCYYQIHGFKRIRDGRVVIMADDGQEFREDGLFVSPSGDDSAATWHTYFREDSASVSGFPVNPKGFVSRVPVTLKFPEWQRVLRHGEPTVAVHIPGTGPMDFAECGDSFYRAHSFFKRHWPERPVDAYTCSSWLLDPQFEHLLKQNSNITRFLKEWYLLPAPGANGRETFRRVFGVKHDETIDLASMPRDTSLRRVVADHLMGGGEWRSHWAVMFPHAMNWGDQVYRSYEDLSLIQQGPATDA